MSLDEDLVHRLRELLIDHDISERKMFGGHVFMVDGHMAIGASHDGRMLIRVDPADAEKLLQKEHVDTMHMNGKTMRNWLKVAPEAIRTKRQLEPWVKRATKFVATLPERR